MSGFTDLCVALLAAIALTSAHGAAAIAVPGKTSHGTRKLLQASNPKQMLLTTQAYADTPRLLRATQGSRILQQLGQQPPAPARNPAAVGATSAVAPTHTATTGAPSKSQPAVSTTTTGQNTATSRPQQPVPAITPASRSATAQPPTAVAAAATTRQPVTTSAPAARADLSDREPTFKPYLCNTGAELRPCHNVTNSAGTAAKLTAAPGRVPDSSLPRRGDADSGEQLAQWAKQQTRSDVTWRPVAQPGAQPPAKTVGEHVLSTQPGVASASD